MNKNTLAVLGVLLVAVIAFVVYQSRPVTVPPPVTPLIQPVAPIETLDTTTTTTTTTTVTTDARVINVAGSNFAFNPSEIRVRKGETVKIVLSNSSSWPHDWVIDEFNARTAVINSGTAEVVFTPDRVGTFEYYCSVGNHRAMGMKGKLIVE